MGGLEKLSQLKSSQVVKPSDFSAFGAGHPKLFENGPVTSQKFLTGNKYDLSTLSLLLKNLFTNPYG